jgi:hypothetical protein
MYQRGIEELVKEFGFSAVRKDLERRLTRTKFFPHPSEVREELEAMTTKRREEESKENPYIVDPECKHVPGGYWQKAADGMVRCACWKRWKESTKPSAAEDRKTLAAGA